jgi:large subunit ribosomal protein L13
MGSERNEGATMGAQAHRATQSTKPADVPRRWFVVDAEDLVLGRMATRVATILRGKHRAIFTPHVDTGEYVIVVNAEKVKLTGRKREQKTYYSHSGYPGGISSITAGKLLESAHADRVVQSAVRGMLPKNSLGRQMLAKLKVYAGPNHPHEAQQPEELRIG